MSSASELVTYPTASDFWDQEGVLLVYDKTGTLMLQLPMRFLRLGHVLTYAYVYEQCLATFEDEGELQKRNGEALDMEELVTAGEIVFVHAGNDLCRPRKGPRFKHKYRTPVAEDDDETMSNSKESYAQQGTFRLDIIARDSACLVSQAWFTRCTTAHILPQSRPEYYDEVLGRPITYHHMPSYGILLRDDLHHSFDRGEIALYPQGEHLIVHIFVAIDDEYRRFHGKILTRTRFAKYCPEAFLPDRRLLRFHYQQCAMKHLRGYAAHMSPPESFLTMGEN